MQPFQLTPKEGGKMNKYSFKFLFVSLFLMVVLIISCKKDEGTGGTSSITGKVIIRQYNSSFTRLEEQYYATDEDVFIIYGDDTYYGDKVSTSYDGTYHFEYLREGHYTVFAYSEDSANYPTKHKIPVIKKIEITGKKQTVQADNIILLK
jgi:hypothetical protein